MKILFTKILNEDVVSKRLGNHFSYDFREVIGIKPLRVSPFDLKDYSLIFSSVNAVESFFANDFRPHENFMEKNFNKIYAVGSQTKKALREKGFGTFKVTRNAKELSEFIIDRSTKEKFLHFCGNLALDVLRNSLPLQNIFYRKIIMYETELLYPTVTEQYGALVFFSPSGVRSFAKFNSFADCKIFSIGETTSEEIRNYSKNPIFTSKENNLDDLLNIIYMQRKK